jgi:HTH-type transcriptional regulator/antitoxin HigA
MRANIAIKPIKTEKDYDRALARVEQLMSAEAGTPEGDALDVLTTLIEAYEARHWAIDLPDPVAAIQERMEQQHLRPKDLEPFIGSSGRVSEVLNRRRPLTLPMIRRLERGLGIPARVLVQEPKARYRPRRKR